MKLKAIYRLVVWGEPCPAVYTDANEVADRAYGIEDSTGCKVLIQKAVVDGSSRLALDWRNWPEEKIEESLTLESVGIEKDFKGNNG